MMIKRFFLFSICFFLLAGNFSFALAKSGDWVPLRGDDSAPPLRTAALSAAENGKASSTAEKIITVSLKDQTLTYSEGTKMIGQFKISSGIKNRPTPPGEYTVLAKKPLVDYKGPGYNYPKTKWNLMFKKGTTLNYYIHGAYWHKNFGYRMSHGCVNVSYKDMEPMYDWADVGTKIVIE